LEDSTTGERFFFIHPEEGDIGVHIGLVDADNDGLFERVDTLTNAEWSLTSDFEVERWLRYNTYAAPTF
jgi:phage FluMu gp28-like protein